MEKIRTSMIMNNQKKNYYIKFLESNVSVELNVVRIK